MYVIMCDRTGQPQLRGVQARADPNHDSPGPEEGSCRGGAGI